MLYCSEEFANVSPLNAFASRRDADAVGAHQQQQQPHVGVIARFVIVWLRLRCVAAAQQLHAKSVRAKCWRVRLECKLQTQTTHKAYRNSRKILPIAIETSRRTRAYEMGCGEM